MDIEQRLVAAPILPVLSNHEINDQAGGSASMWQAAQWGKRAKMVVRAYLQNVTERPEGELGCPGVWSGRLMVALVVCFFWFPGAEAGAQPWSVHGAGTVLVGLSDDSAGVSGAAYYQVRPSLYLELVLPRITHATRLAAELTDARDSGSTASAALSHKTTVAVAPTRDVIVGLDMGVGRTHVARGDLAVPEGMPLGVVTGGARFMRVGLTQSLRWQWSRTMRVHQDMSGRWLTLAAGAGDMTTAVAAFALGLERVWPRTTATLSANSQYLASGRPGRGTTRQFTGHVGAHVRRELSPRLTVHAGAGSSVFSAPSTAAEGGAFQSIHAFKLGADYARPVLGTTMDLALSVHRDYEPDLFLGAISRTTGFALTATMPLPWLRRGGEPRLRLRAGGSGAYSELAGHSGSWYLATFDLAAAWALRHRVDLTLRYRHIRQTVREPAAELLPVARNAVMLELILK